MNYKTDSFSTYETVYRRLKIKLTRFRSAYKTRYRII